MPISSLATILLVLRKLMKNFGMSASSASRRGSSIVCSSRLVAWPSALHVCIALVRRARTCTSEPQTELPLQEYRAREGHSCVPEHHREGTLRLGQWVRLHRARQMNLDIQRKRRLDSFGILVRPIGRICSTGLILTRENMATAT
jgi:hypothetical protein